MKKKKIEVKITDKKRINFLQKQRQLIHSNELYVRFSDLIPDSSNLRNAIDSAIRRHNE